MAPRKKRRRRTIADSGLGVSLKDKEEQLPQEQNNIVVSESVSARKEQESPRENVNCMEERNTEAKDGDASAGKDCGCQENSGGSLEIISLPETSFSISEELNITPESTSLIPPAKKVNTPEQSICGSPVRNSSPEIQCDIPIEVRASLEHNSIIPVATEETVKSPEATSLTSQSLANVNELPVAASNGYEEETKSGPTSIASKETEILFGYDQSLESGGSFHVDDIRASQESRKCTNESNFKEPENVMGLKSTANVQLDHSPPMERFSCPAEIGIHREAVSCHNQSLPKVTVPLPAKEVSFQDSEGFQLLHTIFPAVRINSEDSVRQGPEKLTGQHNKGGQTEKRNTPTQPSLQSLSVWSEAHSEYFPCGKPSDLGELLDIATRYVVRAWVKNIRPSISGSPVNLVMKFCPECHRKYSHNEDINDHLCSSSKSGSTKSPKLIYYAELEIYDETHEMLRVALTGIQAIKLFGCKPAEFIQNEETQMKVWNAFKNLIKGGNTQNWCLKDAADFSLEPHLKGKEMNYRVIDIRPFGPKFK